MSEPIFDQLTSAPQEDAMTTPTDPRTTPPAPGQPADPAAEAMAAAAVGTPAANAAPTTDDVGLVATVHGVTAVPAASHLRSMVDSAYPLHQPPAPVPDIVLIYAGGDTVHPWTPAEIAAMPERYRWPCWVRSNPQDHDPAVDAAMFAHWLQAHGVPKGTCVILDLEVAVDAAYVTAFNLALRLAGWKTTKYGSQDSIWDNPKTDGGTFLALPGKPELTGEGDEVARQWQFDATHDMDVVKDQASVPLWDMRPQHAPYRHAADGTRSLARIAEDRGTTRDHLVAVSRAGLHGAALAEFEAYLAGKMSRGTPYCTTNP